MKRDDRRWYPPARPKLPPPEHGVRVRTVGATWWGLRWISALERLSPDYPNRLARGRSYARAGRVHELEVVGGTVRARVTGSRPSPYRVSLEVQGLSNEAWLRAIERMGRKAVFAAQLLVGEMPAEIDEAFSADGASLFPRGKEELHTQCSCPDDINPCKHVAATHYVLGQALDRDPFLLFELRGRGRDEILGALRRSRARRPGTTPLEAADLATAVPSMLLELDAAEAYERSRGSLSELRFRIGPPRTDAAVLQQLGAPSSWSISETVVDLLGPAYEAAGALARRLALSQDGPVGEP